MICHHPQILTISIFKMDLLLPEIEKNLTINSTNSTYTLSSIMFLSKNNIFKTVVYTEKNMAVTINDSIFSIFESVRVII